MFGSFVSYSESYKKEQEELVQKINELELKLQNYEKTKERELMQNVEDIISFKNIDRNIVLNLVEKIEIIDKENIRINYKYMK